MRAAVTLLGERLVGAEEGLSWGPGILISFAGAILLTAIVITSIIHAYRAKNLEKVEDPESSDVMKDRPAFKRVDDSPPSSHDGPAFKKI